jgi:hypothetical protein
MRPNDVQMCSRWLGVEESRHNCTAGTREISINGKQTSVVATTHENLRTAPKTMMHWNFSSMHADSNQTHRELIICCKFWNSMLSLVNFIEHSQRIHLILFDVECALNWDHWKSTSNKITLHSCGILKIWFSSIVCLIFQLLTCVRLDECP